MVIKKVFKDDKVEVNTNGRVLHEDDPLLPSPAVCGTPVLASNELSPSSARSSTEMTKKIDDKHKLYFKSSNFHTIFSVLSEFTGIF